MCGRFSLYEDGERVAERFEAAAEPGTLPVRPSWNIAPTQRIVGISLRVPGAADDATRHAPIDPPGDAPSAPLRGLSLYRWGLLGPWVTDPARAGSTFNARAETAAAKPTFRAAFATRRLIVPANGYYEWRRPRAAPAEDGSVGAGGDGPAGAGGGRPTTQPKECRLVRRVDGDLLAFAGLWQEWHHPTDKSRTLRTATILTVGSGADTADLHDRQPVVLDPGAWQAWLDPSIGDAEAVTALLVPSPAGTLTHHRVDPRVGKVANNDASLVVPLRELAG